MVRSVIRSWLRRKLAEGTRLVSLNSKMLGTHPIQLEDRMDATKWNGAILNVNLSKYDRYHQPINYASQQRMSVKVARVVKKDSMESIGDHNGLKSHVSSRSYRDVCKGVPEMQKKEIKEIVMDKPQNFYPAHCMGRSILAIVREFKDLVSLKTIIKGIGCADYTLAYLGG